ncbi:hypothetical protein BKA82DRAFT_328433 [Pisolithus tinctorius]|nr:hypothetical protein BKA82DRAFT_328433 [Pisolithus tinctorius]
MKRRLSPIAKRMADGILEPLMKEHGLDMRYLPCVNKYPRPLREHVALLSCEPDDEPESESDELQVPDNIFDGAHDPWVVLGITAWLICRDVYRRDTELHSWRWHRFFPRLLRGSLKCFNMPALPRLSSTSVRLCHELDRDYSEQLFFSNESEEDSEEDSDWVPSDHADRPLRLSTVVFVAAAMFLRSNDIGLSPCQKCRAIFMKSLADTLSSAGFEVIDSGNDTQGGSVSPSPWGSLKVNIQQPAWMEEFTTMLRNPSLSKDEVQSRVAAELLKLVSLLSISHCDFSQQVRYQRKYLDSCGLDVSDCFQRSGGDNSPCLESVMLTRF